MNHIGTLDVFGGRDFDEMESDVLTVRTGPLTGLMAQLALLAVLSAAAGLGGVGLAVGLAVGGTTTALLTAGLSWARVADLTPADRVTLSRAVLVGGVAALVADGFTGSAARPAVVTLAVFALLLDGVDGWVARRTGSSPLGARFDMEVDAFLILALSVQAARMLGPWVLAIGLARYLLGAAGWRLAWLREPTPTRYWGKVVAAIQGIVLTVAVADVLPRPLATALSVGALALLAESFGRQVWWLRCHRPAPVPTDRQPADLAGCR